MSTATATDLKAAWEKLQAEQPKLRIRDAALALGVSEAQLLATTVGDTAVRLVANEWQELVKELPRLGEVMALTRNEAAVIEKEGTYAEPQFFGPMGQVVDPNIDLRLFMQHWKHAYAATHEIRGKQAHSLQFFDAQGEAIHKVYVYDETKFPIWQEIVDRYRSPEQPTTLEVEPAPAPRGEMPDDQIDAAGLLQTWSELKDTHDFFKMLGQYRVGRTQALRLAEGKFTYRIPADAFYKAVEQARDTKLDVMFFVGNKGMIEIHTGPVERIVPMDGWFNIMDPGFNLHLRTDLVDSAWVVLKPTVDGVVTAIELYDKAGENIVLMFGKRKPGSPELQGWRDIVNSVLGQQVV